MTDIERYVQSNRGFAGLRSQAKRDGLKYYSTGAPCINGHTAKRWTADGKCLECNKERRQVGYKNNPEKYLAWAKAYRLRKPTAQKFRHLKRRHGLTAEAYHAMLEDHGNCCAICKTASSGSKIGLCVDHCHASGGIRGLLCSNCNTALGLAGDSIPVLKSMIDYLERYAKAAS